MNAAKPIQPEEFKKFRAELYALDEKLGREGLRYEVGLDSDPTLNPKAMAEKLAKVQGYKDRVLSILNRAVLAEAYWKAVASKVKTKLDAETKRQAITPTVMAAKNSETREALASTQAAEIVSGILFPKRGPDGNIAYNDKGKPLSEPLENHQIAIASNQADASAFLDEVKNIYDNLESTGVALALQIKSVMISAKVFDGADVGEPGRDGRQIRHPSAAGALSIG